MNKKRAAKLLFIIVLLMACALVRVRLCPEKVRTGGSEI